MVFLKHFFTLGLVLIMLQFSALSQTNREVQDAFRWSYQYENSGEYQKAADMLTKVYSDSSYEVNLRLGWVSYLLGSHLESQIFYQKAISLSPLSIEARLGYVYPTAELGNWEQVISIYKDVLEIDSLNTLALYSLGVIYYNRNDFQNAFNVLNVLAVHYPFDYDSLLYFAWTNLRLGKTEEAKGLFNRVLLIKPDDSSALEGLSLIK